MSVWPMGGTNHLAMWQNAMNIAVTAAGFVIERFAPMVMI